MRASLVVGFLAALSFSACQQSPAARPLRTEIREVTGNTFELLPVDGRLPKAKSGELFCLVFTQAQSGVVRQLTMTHENKSLHCTPGQPIGNVRYRIPVNEGPVKVHVFYSDQKLNAASIAQQLYEKKGDPSFRPIDLRLPGTVIVDTLTFEPRPAAEVPPMVGGVVGSGGEVLEDGGTGIPDAGPNAL